MAKYFNLLRSEIIRYSADVGQYAASARFFINFNVKGGAVMKRNYCLALGYHFGELPNRNIAPQMPKEYK